MAILGGQIPHLWKYGITRIVSLPVGLHSVSQHNTHLQKFTTMNFSSMHILRSQICTNKRLCAHQSGAFRNDLKSLLACRRQTYSNRVTSPYKVSRDLSRDMLVYSYENKKMYRYLTIFGVIQFIMWVNVSSFFYEFFHAADQRNIEREREKSWWKRLMALQTKYKYSSAIFCMMIGTVALFVTWIYPLRTVHKLTVLRGGQKLRVTTYYHFGMTRDVSIPLEHISFTSSRQYRKDSTLSAKIKGKWFYFMLDTRSGKFHNPDVFDHVVGLERKL